MAELLIRSGSPAPTGDAAQDALRYGDGDVVAVREDGFPWGAGDCDPALFRILRIPGASVEWLIHLTAPAPAEPGMHPRIRLWHLPGHRDLPDEVVSTEALLAAAVRHRRVPDDAVIGDDPTVIG